MKVLVLGGDGFCGWPTALHLSNLGHDVAIVDNLSRRKIDVELEVDSLTPIRSMSERLAAWKEVSGRDIRFENLTLGQDFDRFVALLKAERPDAIVHFAEQRAAPYSMKSQECNIENGRVKEQNFDTYKLARMSQAPVVDVHFLDTNYPPTGVGEPAFPPAVPAICNAIYAATKHRIRTLPITREGFTIA